MFPGFASAIPSVVALGVLRLAVAQKTTDSCGLVWEKVDARINIYFNPNKSE